MQQAGNAALEAAQARGCMEYMAVSCLKSLLMRYLMKSRAMFAFLLGSAEASHHPG